VGARRVEQTTDGLVIALMAEASIKGAEAA